MNRRLRLQNLIKARRKWHSMSKAQRRKTRVYTHNPPPKKYTGNINYTSRGKVYRGAFHLPIETAVYVPSTTKGQKQIPVSAMNKRVNSVRGFLAGKYGGYTSVSGTGGYKMGKKTVREPVVKVTAFSTTSDFKKNHPKVKKQLSSWRKKWNQDTIGYEYEGDLYYLK